MNSAAVPKTGENQKYNGKITLLILLSCFMATAGGFVFGYDLGISGGVTSMTTFLKKFFPDVYTGMKENTKVSNYCKFNSQVLTLFTSSLYLAGAVASFFGLLVTRVFGRKPSIIMGGVAFLIGSALGSSASNLYLLILSRVLLGAGLGFTEQAVPLYISEVALPKHRGKMNAGFGTGITFGVLVANLTNFGTVKIKGGWGWRVSLAMPAVPAAILSLCALFLPETPNNLMLSSKNHQKAKRVLERIRGTTDIQMTGIDIITFYAPILFRTIGRGEKTSLLLAVVVRSVSTAFAVSMMVLVDKIGRKKLFMIGGIQMFLSQIVLGGVLAAMLGDHGALTKRV